MSPGEIFEGGERLFARLRSFTPSQRVLSIGVCQILTPILKGTGDPRAEIAAAAIDAVCRRFDTKGRLKK